MTDAETEKQESRRPGGALRAASVSRAYEGVRALRDVTFELNRHEVVGLIGPNGAGKSTLVNVLTGFDFPDEGTVELAGRDITRWSPHRRGRQGLARTFQHSRSFRGPVRPRERRGGGHGSGSGAARRSAPRGRAPRAPPARALRCAPAGSLPQGDERRLGVARALATEPEFVLLDEPAAGLPEAEVGDFADVIRSVVAEHDAGVLLIDHNMALVMGVCDRIQVLDHGATLAEGTPGEIRANLDVAAAYLGESAIQEEGA